MSAPAASAALEPFKQNIFNNCPGGLCELVQRYSSVLLVILIIDGLFFLVTLLPPLFSWGKRKPDGKKRIIFAFLACVTFYSWLTFLIFNSVYCFGFLAHEGPCKYFNRTSESYTSNVSTTTSSSSPESPRPTDSPVTVVENSVDSPVVAELIWNTANESCSTPISPHEADLRNLTAINIGIIVVLVVVLIANAREALSAKSLHYKETLCKKEDVQKFLSSLVGKPPEVGHYVSCFHPAKSPDVKTNATRKVITFSTIENFTYNSWRDFSDVRLIEPSMNYPIIEIEIVLNFFPGDHYTAEKYKGFVVQLTKENSGKDAKINIDDYFHIEDHREWTFFIGNPDYISPWWNSGVGRALISCVFLFGWPFRMGYHGRIAKHQIEVKKAVFCENTSQDEGVSLSATPGSSSNETAAPNSNAANANNTNAVSTEKEDNQAENHEEQTANAANTEVDGGKSNPTPKAPPSVPAAGASAEMNPHSQPLQQTNIATAPPMAAMMDPDSKPLHLDVGLRQNEQLVNAVISNPPAAAAAAAVHLHQTHLQQHTTLRHHPLQQPQHQQQLLSQHHHNPYSTSTGVHISPPMPPQRSVPITSPRTHLRETRDIVTAVTHHQDINGVNAVNTIALKDIDVQMSALSGYETYV